MLNNTILVIGSTGKTGKRVVTALEQRGSPVRHGSRSADIPFDWNAPSAPPARFTWLLNHLVLGRRPPRPACEPSL